jgi:hypothetical protein
LLGLEGRATSEGVAGLSAFLPAEPWKKRWIRNVFAAVVVVVVVVVAAIGSSGRAPIVELTFWKQDPSLHHPCDDGAAPASPSSEGAATARVDDDAMGDRGQWTCDVRCKCRLSMVATQSHGINVSRLPLLLAL